MSETNNTPTAGLSTGGAPAQTPVKKSVKRRTSDSPKTSVALKRLWHRFCEENGKMPLKAFLRQEKDNPEVKALTKEWRDHKKGSLEKVAKAARQKNKGARIAAEKLASKQARRKSKSGGSKPAA